MRFTTEQIITKLREEEVHLAQGKTVVQRNQACFRNSKALRPPDRGALPVYHTPILDESETDNFEGFNPDGSTARIDFEATELPYPLLYVHFDEEFFWKSENMVYNSQLEPEEVLAQHLREKVWQDNGLWRVLSDLAVPSKAYAHKSKSSHYGCYHGNQSEVRLFEIYDDHESAILGKPEIVTKSKFVFIYPESNEWKKEKVEFKKVDDEDHEYNEDDDSWLPKVLHDHGADDCDFTAWPRNNRRDEANFAIWEEDLAPNDDDRVAKWVNVPTMVSDVNILNPSSRFRTNDPDWPRDAKIHVGLVEDMD